MNRSYIKLYESIPELSSSIWRVADWNSFCFHYLTRNEVNSNEDSAKERGSVTIESREGNYYAIRVKLTEKLRDEDPSLYSQIINEANLGLRKNPELEYLNLTYYSTEKRHIKHVAKYIAAKYGLYFNQKEMEEVNVNVKYKKFTSEKEREGHSQIVNFIKNCLRTGTYLFYTEGLLD